MTNNIDNTVNDSAQPADSNSKSKKTRNPVLTAPLPDPISKNIESITSFHTQAVHQLPAHQRFLEAIATFFGKPIFLYSLLFGMVFWIFSSYFEHLLPFKLPPFSWGQQGLDAAALMISTGVLVQQTRQGNFAEQRSQLMLQLNLLSEQKIAKMISLLEELRTDLPEVINRDDPEAELMQEAADPIAVLEALQDSITQELSSEAKENVV